MMLRTSLRVAFRQQISRFRAPSLGKCASPIRSQWLQSLTYSSAKNNGNPGAKSRSDDDLLKMDIDAAEKHMKDWFGDHTSWDHQKLLNLVYGMGSGQGCITSLTATVDDLISFRNIQEFGDYAVAGIRPGGGRPSFALMTNEEWALMDAPYNQWAPAPHNNKHYTIMDKLEPLMTGDRLDGLKTTPHADFLARLRPLKAKLRLGMVPISRDRWLERRMGDPANYRNLFELMNDVVLLFRWLNDEEILKCTREVFNWMVDKYLEFEEAANLRRKQSGVKERLNLAGMWAEYWNDTHKNMTNRTHQWIVDRVDEIQIRAFEEYKEALEKAGNDVAAIGEAGKRYYECVQDLRGMLTKVDYTLCIPMTGMKGYSTCSNAFSDLPLAYRRDLYIKVLGTKSFTHQAAILDAQDRADKEDASNPPHSLADRIDLLRKPAHPRFRDSKNFLGHFEEGKQNRDETRLALRGCPTLPCEEHWITILRERMGFYLQHKSGKDHKSHRWGFAMYRLTYGQTDEEWETFMKKLQADLDRSGQWIEGYENIANRKGVEYFDGRELGIAEGDIEAAKRHFKATYTTLPTVGRIWTQDFLVIDKQSFASYTQPPKEEVRPPPPYGPGFGCNGGHVRLVDTTLDQISKELIDATSPGYNGEMKVLSTLVFEELYPLLATLTVRPFGLWPCARLHPREVYVGTTDASQEAWWEFNRIDQAMSMGVFDHMRKKKAALLAKKTS